MRNSPQHGVQNVTAADPEFVVEVVIAAAYLDSFQKSTCQSFSAPRLHFWYWKYTVCVSSGSDRALSKALENGRGVK